MILYIIFFLVTYPRLILVLIIYCFTLGEFAIRLGSGTVSQQLGRQRYLLTQENIKLKILNFQGQRPAGTQYRADVEVWTSE